MKNNAKEIGNRGEAIAARYIKQRGFVVSKTNYHSRFGEIDIIAENNEYLLFIEVKTRAQNSIAAPRAFVTKTKQQRIIKTARYYLMYNPTGLKIRFDVAEVIKDDDNGFENATVNYIENAFGV